MAITKNVAIHLVIFVI